MRPVFIFCLSTLFILSCGDDTSSSPTIGSAISLVGNKLDATADIVGTSSRMRFTPLRAALSGVWATDPGVSPLSNSGTSSLQTWMENMFNPDFTNSNSAKVTFAGRISNALSIFCYLGASGVTMDSTNLPEVGTHSLTITGASAQSCDSSNDGSTDLNVRLVSSNTSNTTIYAKKLVVTLPGQESCPFTIYARNDSSHINIATSEDQTCDSRDQASRTVFRYNASTQVSRFNYISQAFTDNSRAGRGFEYYRGMLDEVNDVAYVLGHYGDDRGSASSTGVFEAGGGLSFTAVGKPSAGGTTAVSVRSRGNTISDGEYDGCVNATSNAVSSDSLSCTATGTAIGNSYTNTAVGTIKSDHDVASQVSDIYTLSETTDVPFTDSSDIF